MTMIKNFVARFHRDEDGASMVEYAVALLVVTAIGVGLMTVIGDNAGAIVTDACTVLNEGATGTTTGAAACL